MANDNKIFDFGEKLGDSVKDRNFGVRTMPPRQQKGGNDDADSTKSAPRYSLEIHYAANFIYAELKNGTTSINSPFIVMRNGEEIFRETGRRNYALQYFEEHREELLHELESYDFLRYSYPILFSLSYTSIKYKVIGKTKEGVVQPSDFLKYSSLVGNPNPQLREARAFEYIHTHYTQLLDMVATKTGLDFTDKAGLFATIRNAPAWRENGRNATEQDFLDVFGFRAVEFGETMPQKERWQHMNRAYDSFMDLANALGFSPSSIAMGGRLAICFGSRGHGGKAAAHYEPGRNVINLTRKYGAGSLAHEWFHALDYSLGGDAATKNPKLCQSGYTMAAIGTLTQTLSDSQMAKDSNVLGGYWKDVSEMAARAFEAYVQDKLRSQGWENEYLVQLPEVKTQIHPYPHGTERETFNACFHSLFSTFVEVAGAIKNTELQ